jgi:gas vesicle protein
MSEDTNNRSQGVGVAWFLAGLGVGALIGVLYAPKSGRETREDLAQKARDGQDYLRERSKQAAEQMGNAMDKGKEQMNQYIGRGRDIADRGRAQWQDFVERGKNLVNEKGNRVGAAIDAGREAYRTNTTTSTEPAEPSV